MSEASLQIRVFLLLLVAVIVLVLLDNLLEEHASLINCLLSSIGVSECSVGELSSHLLQLFL